MQEELSENIFCGGVSKLILVSFERWGVFSTESRSRALRDKDDHQDHESVEVRQPDVDAASSWLLHDREI